MTSTTTRTSSRPESISYALGTWWVLIAFEFIHQILQVVMGFMDPADLMAAARDRAAKTDVSPSLVESSVYTTLIFMGLINIAVVGLLAGAVWLITKRKKQMLGARQLLIIFSVFMAIRASLVLFGSATPRQVPEWIVLIDGSLQLLAATSGILGIIYASRGEAIDWFVKKGKHS